MKIGDLKASTLLRDDELNRTGRYGMKQGRHFVDCWIAVRPPLSIAFSGVPRARLEVRREWFDTKREARDWLVDNGFEVIR